MVAIRFPTEGNSCTTTSLLPAELELSELCSGLGIITKISDTAEMVHSVGTGVFSSWF